MQVIRALALTMLAAGSAQAFSGGSQFDLDPVMFDGGGGIPFDGSPRGSLHTCAVCHTNPPGIIAIQLEADQPSLFTDGYKPGKQYHLRVVMQHEAAGIKYNANSMSCGFSSDPYKPCNQNGFALELDDDTAAPRGALAVFENGACAGAGVHMPGDSVYILADGTAAVQNSVPNAAAWDVCWTAPAAGTGPITAYVATVDGNGGDGTANFVTDSVNDDVASGAVPIPELGATVAPEGSGGCASTRDGSLLVGLVLLGLVRFGRVARLGHLWRLGRRRNVAVLAIVAITGCTHVRPAERETLAKRNMKFSPDPAEDELDLHMQEAREGSAGGYGSAGGGCGCN